MMRRIVDLQPFGTVLAAALIAAFAVGCAGRLAPDEAERADRFEEMAETGLSEIQAIYIDDLPTRRLTLAGLAGLQRLAPTVTFAAEDGQASARMLDGTELARARLPDDADPGRWAATATDLLFQARARSPKLSAAQNEELYRAFFDGMLEELDRFSRYAGRDDAREARAEREGFGGIGLSLSGHPDGARIEDVLPGNPGAAAGLLVGDIIVAIDGEAVGGEPIRRVIERLRGPVDEAVVVKVRRTGLDDPFDVTVGRTRIVPDTVFYERRGKHAIIRISSFNQRTAKRLAEAIGRARSAPEGPAKGLVLDLRGNPGGLLDQAVDSADLFLNVGLISRTDGRHPNSHQRFEAEPGDLADGLPVAVLINGASASAAEILASALQDQGRAVPVGMNSFGKGSIQTVVGLPNDGELYITWARFVAPSGYPLHRFGVSPTICTAGAQDAVQALNAGLDENREKMTRALAQRRTAGPDDERMLADILSACPWQPHGDADIDLAVAELLLDSPALYEQAIALGRAPAGG